MMHFMILSLFVFSAKISLASVIEEFEGNDPSFFEEETPMVCDRKCLSKNRMYYYLDSQIDIEDRRNIKSAMDQIERYTCVRFVESLPQEDFTDYITILRDRWCWSHDRNYVEEACLLIPEFPRSIPKGNMLHMLLHALGLKHEHQRPDRNKFISINWDNILEGFDDYFTKDKRSPVDLSRMDFKYDYESVMHYSSHMYAKDVSKPVITIRRCGMSSDILGRGLKNGRLTKFDVQKIMLLYPC